MRLSGWINVYFCMHAFFCCVAPQYTVRRSWPLVAPCCEVESHRRPVRTRTNKCVRYSYYQLPFQSYGMRSVFSLHLRPVVFGAPLCWLCFPRFGLLFGISVLAFAEPLTKPLDPAVVWNGVLMVTRFRAFVNGWLFVPYACLCSRGCSSVRGDCIVFALSRLNAVQSAGRRIVEGLFFSLHM